MRIQLLFTVLLLLLSFASSHRIEDDSNQNKRPKHYDKDGHDGSLHHKTKHHGHHHHKTKHHGHHGHHHHHHHKSKHHTHDHEHHDKKPKHDHKKENKEPKIPKTPEEPKIPEIQTPPAPSSPEEAKAPTAPTSPEEAKPPTMPTSPEVKEEPKPPEEPKKEEPKPPEEPKKEEPTSPPEGEATKQDQPTAAPITGGLPPAATKDAAAKSICDKTNFPDICLNTVYVANSNTKINGPADVLNVLVSSMIDTTTTNRDDAKELGSMTDADQAKDADKFKSYDDALAALQQAKDAIAKNDKNGTDDSIHAAITAYTKIQMAFKDSPEGNIYIEPCEQMVILCNTCLNILKTM